MILLPINMFLQQGGWTVLLGAAAAGDVNSVRAFIAVGANLRTKDELVSGQPKL